MAAFADLERFLERLFERTSARVFRSRIQVVQVQRRVERAMEAGRSGRGASTVVPNRFRVRLHPADLDDVAGRAGGHEALAGSLAESALAFARLHGYHLAARPTVSVLADPIVERGTVEVDASVSRPTAAGSGSVPGAVPPAPSSPAAEPIAASGVLLAVNDVDEADGADDLAGLVAPAESAGRIALAGLASESRPPAPAVEPAPAAPALAASPSPAPDPATPAPATQAHPGLRHAADQPYAVRPAAPPPARALLRISEPGGRERDIRVEDRPLTLGRAPDNGLVIVDARVSRHHGRFQHRHGTLIYTDLGSTNGTRVNGIRVDEIVLGAGDRLQLGDVVVVVEQLPR
ncbi:MAG: FhaA domain-containing protein [Chloroflexota bacterium]